MSSPCPVLADLADQLLALWAAPEQTRRRLLWADHFNGRTREVPVSCAMFQGSQDLVWQQILPEDAFVHKEGLARSIETHLRHSLWRGEHIGDDTPLDPTLVLSAAPAMPEDGLWGVPLDAEYTDRPGGAYKPIPPLEDPADIVRLKAPEFSVDRAAIDRQTDAVRGLVGDGLPVAFHCNATHNGPFEWAVRLRGMDNLLLDVYDWADWLKELMAFLCEAIVAYHRGREAAGMVHAPTECALHSPWDDFDAPSSPAPVSRGNGAPAPLQNLGSLLSSWGYLHAQSSASYGPDAYAEFVQPYNVPIAELFGMVYYHACETMDRKAPIIRDLPNLRQFHVSPWSDPAVCAEALPADVVMEVHSHPTNVLFLWDEAEMGEELRGLVEACGDQPFNLKLCDIQTINDDAGQALITWARVAKRLALGR